MGHDSILKERLFGLTNGQGNHGEDVKEYYYYLDSTPTHSYMKMLYKYPQREFPYVQLVEESAKRTRKEPEYELLDTGIFDDNRYFDVFIEYAKAGIDDILIQITVHNRGPETGPHYGAAPGVVSQYLGLGPRRLPAAAEHRPSPAPCRLTIQTLGALPAVLRPESGPAVLRQRNQRRPPVCDLPSEGHYFKDGINDYVVDGKLDAINPAQTGTKAAAQYTLHVPAGRVPNGALAPESGHCNGSVRRFRRRIGRPPAGGRRVL